MTSVPSRTVNLAASELPDFVNALPKLLAEYLTIRVSGSLTANQPIVEDFYGPGALTIVQTDETAVFEVGVSVIRCSVPVTISSIRFQDHQSGSGNARSGISASYNSHVTVINCSFTSIDGGANPNNGYRAVEVFRSGSITVIGLQASNCTVVALASRGGTINCEANSAADLHDNYIGAYVWNGGTIILNGNTPDTLGGTTNAKDGGMIVKRNGTLL